MHKKLIAAAVFALAVSACKSDKGSRTTSQSEDASASTPDSDSAPTTSTPEPTETPKLEITEDVVKRYLDYTEKQTDLARATLKELGVLEAEAKAKGNDAAASTVMVAKITELNRATARKQDDLKKESGFSDADIDTIRSLVDEVVLGRKMAKDAKMDEVLATSRAELAKQPADRRAEAEKNLKQMEDNHQATMKATSAREKHGDDAVEAVLKHEERAQAIWMKKFEALK